MRNPIFVHVTRKRDVNGNTIYRCRSNSMRCQPMTIKKAYSDSDAVQCYIKQTLPGHIVMFEAPGFDDKSKLFSIEEA